MAAKALTIAVFGARGTGKTAWIKQRYKRERTPRLMVWDFKNDPSLEDLGTAYTSLPALITALRAKTFQVRYIVNHQRDIHQQFEIFCQAAWEASCLEMFVDELPEVTKANKAPPAWRRCVNVGRDYRDSKGVRKWLAICGAAQRPAEVDKSFIGNADVIHTGRIGNAVDADKLGKEIGCPAGLLLSLPDLSWVEKDSAKTGFSQGKLKFNNNISTAKA